MIFGFMFRRFLREACQRGFVGAMAARKPLFKGDFKPFQNRGIDFSIVRRVAKYPAWQMGRCRFLAGLRFPVLYLC
jgi:hypothetical protein